jgi:hypothetical protein
MLLPLTFPLVADAVDARRERIVDDAEVNSNGHPGREQADVDGEARIAGVVVPNSVFGQDANQNRAKLAQGYLDHTARLDDDVCFRGDGCLATAPAGVPSAAEEGSRGGSRGKNVTHSHPLPL